MSSATISTTITTTCRSRSRLSRRRATATVPVSICLARQRVGCACQEQDPGRRCSAGGGRQHESNGICRAVGKILRAAQLSSQ